MEKPQFDNLMNKLDEISKKLNVLIAPQFKRESKKQDKEITRENIRKLRDCGLNYIEIAGILEMKSGTVANELSYLKKNEKQNKEEEQENSQNLASETRSSENETKGEEEKNEWWD